MLEASITAQRRGRKSSASLAGLVTQKSAIMAKSENSNIWIVTYNSSDSPMMAILRFLHDSPTTDCRRLDKHNILNQNKR